MQAKILSLFVAVPIALVPAAAFAQAQPATPATPATPTAPATPATPAAPAAAAGVTLSATLNGANEVDAQGAGGKGDTDGTGSFTGRLVPGKNDQLCYTLTTAKIDEATMAHIHKGAAGVNGPVFVGLPDLDPGEHCLDIDNDRASALKSKPQDYYVNVHNGDFPGGALRGQLTKN